MATAAPAPVAIVPRRFEFRDLESIPKYWFAGNKIVTHFENTFSIWIPPGERFFIQSVRNYADRVADDPELTRQIQAFIQQEGHHTRSHHQFNAHLASHGIAVEREAARAAVWMDRAARWLPKRIQLGITVFFEHLTACGAHLLYAEPEIANKIAAEALRFWRWHAAEELEHKAVAFDLLRRVGGGWGTRMLSLVVGLLFFGPGFTRAALRMIREDPEPTTDAIRDEARALNQQAGRIQQPLLLAYLKPGFHPWNLDDRPHLAEFYASLETS